MCLCLNPAEILPEPNVARFVKIGLSQLLELKASVLLVKTYCGAVFIVVIHAVHFLQAKYWAIHIENNVSPVSVLQLCKKDLISLLTK